MGIQGDAGLKVYSDYKSLATFLSTTKLTERLARWADELSEYNFSIEYRPGETMGKPDAMKLRSQDLVGSDPADGFVLPRFRFAEEVVTSWDLLNDADKDSAVCIAGAGTNVAPKRTSNCSRLFGEIANLLPSTLAQ